MRPSHMLMENHPARRSHNAFDLSSPQQQKTAVHKDNDCGDCDGTWNRKPNLGTICTMITVSVDDIKRDLIGYLRRVQAGETLVITQANKPLAEIKPISETTDRDAEQLRPFALCEGDFVVPDDFDAPLPEEILSRFEGG